MSAFDEQPDASEPRQIPLHRYCECATAHLFDLWTTPHCECHREEGDPAHIKERA